MEILLITLIAIPRLRGVDFAAIEWGADSRHDIDGHPRAVTGAN